jgi:putrescine aminotransferase
VRHLITTRGGYHGKTMGALSVTPRAAFQDPFHPLLPGVSVVPYDDLVALEEALEGSPRSALILEPVQGEAGVVVPSPGYLLGAQALVRAHDGLLLVDEVQTGFARTGPFWASLDQGLEPDVLLTAKGLSGGVVPAAAVATTEELYKPFDRDPFLHSSTYAGAPLAMAAVLGALEVMEEDDVPRRSAEVGAMLLPPLRDLAQRVPGVLRDVRGSGCLIGLELTDPGQAGQALVSLLDQRLLVNHSLVNPSVLRLTPSAYLSAEEAARAVAALTTTVELLEEQY